MQKQTLVILLGPTGVGKTELSLRLSKLLEAPILSSDSRQFYCEMKIGTAAPTAEQLLRAPHYFIANKHIYQPYSAGQYEIDAIATLGELFKNHNTVILSGGSMLYIDAVCKGIDDLPKVDPELREELQNLYRTRGIAYIRSQLKLLDPVYYEQVDLMNAKRILHALEICIMTQKPFSTQRTNPQKKRPFEQLKIGLKRPREELYDRINRRVEDMMRDGLEEEARKLYQYRHYNALNTVGYKEMFAFFDGRLTREQAVEQIQRNTRRYAKKQLTWFDKDLQINWFHPSQEKKIVQLLCKKQIISSCSNIC